MVFPEREILRVFGARLSPFFLLSLSVSWLASLPYAQARNHFTDKLEKKLAFFVLSSAVCVPYRTMFKF